MRDIYEVIDECYDEWLRELTPELEERLKMMRNIEKCWFDVHLVADEKGEFPEVIHTHGLLYHFDKEIEVVLTPFHPKLRIVMAKKVVQILNEALHSNNDPYEAIMNNRYFSTKKVEDRLEEEDGFPIYNEEPYLTAVYLPTAWE